MSFDTDMHLEVSVRLSEKFDFYPRRLRDIIETASSEALSGTSTGPQASTRVVWIVQDVYHITPDTTNPGMLAYTYEEGHAEFSKNIVGVYEALEKANVAALSQFLDSSALVEDEAGMGQIEEGPDGAADENETSIDLEDYEEEDDYASEDQNEDQIPLRVKNRLRFVDIEDTDKFKLEYGDVGWSFDSNGALYLSTRQEVQGVANEQGHCAALDEQITVVVERMDLLT